LRCSPSSRCAPHAGFAIPLVWLFVVATVADLLNSLVGGMRAGVLGSAHGVT